MGHRLPWFWDYDLIRWQSEPGFHRFKADLLALGEALLGV